VYFNSDNTGRGALAAGGSPTLETFLAEVLRDVNEPSGPRSLLDSAVAASKAGRTNGPEGLRLAPLGSGSDYVAFLDHAGIASLNLGFAGGDAGVYHSIYDTMAWFDRFSDGDEAYGRALAQVMATSLLRLAEAPVLPFDFGAFNRAVHDYADSLQKEAQKSSSSARGTQPPGLDLRGVQFQLMRLDAAAKAYEEQLALAMKRAPALPTSRLAKVNEVLQKAEGALLLPEGLPGREWYRHQIYAPGLYTGYDAKTLPGIREAVEAQHYEEANQQARRVAQALRALVSQVEEATGLLK
jgi:N-acetylated-alpha-linked acidic dipeptidase